MNTQRVVLNSTLLNNPRIAKAGIEARQKILDTVREYPGLASIEYAKKLRRNPSDVNRILRELAHRGFLYTKPHGNARHSWHVSEIDHDNVRIKVMCKPWSIDLFN